MGNKVTVTKQDGEVLTFEDILGHQIGNGALQVLFMNGGSRIIFSPEDVVIELDAEATTKFKRDLDMQMEVANQQAQEKVPVEEEPAQVEH